MSTVTDIGPAPAVESAGVTRRRRGRRLAAVLVALFVLLAVAAGASAASLYAWDAGYQGRVLPGVSVGSVDVSGMTRDEATAAISAAYPFGDGPPDMPIKPDYKDWLMHCWLQVGDHAIMGADIPPEFGPNIDKPKNGFDVTLHTDDKAQGQRWFDQLCEGGKPVMPFSETFWSPGFGSLVDRFGIPWMINTIPSAGWRPAQA